MYFDIIMNYGTHQRELIRSNNSTIHVDGAHIEGNNNEVYGDNNIIIGNNNDVEGHHNKVTGNNSDVKGDYCTVIGNNSDVKGYKCTVRGNNCDYYPKKKPKYQAKHKSIVKHLDEMLDDAKRNPHSVENSEKFAEMVRDQRKMGKKERKEVEKKCKEVEKIKNRKWFIDNVRLSDKEYKEVEDFMDEIKILWEIW